MPTIPAGDFDSALVAEALYGTDVRERLFAEARERYRDRRDAVRRELMLDYVLDGFEHEFSDRYTADQWGRIRDELHDHVYDALN